MAQQPHSTQALAAVKTGDDTGRKIAVGCGGCLSLVLFVVFGLLMGLEFLGTIIDRPLIAIASAFLAILICIPYGLFFIWIDRNEREPFWLLGLTFLWGAVLATGISLIFNTSFGVLSEAVLGNPALAQQATASFSAPIVEEITKGLAILLIFVAFPRHFDNVLDGVVYGAIAGLGFATYENYIYYVRQPDLGMVFQVFWIRGIVAAIGSHAIYSAITGAGLGIFRVMRTGFARWLLPPAALAFSMFVHFAWNTFAQFFTYGAASKIEVLAIRFPLAALVLHVPFTLGVLIIAGIALYHEAKMIREFLDSEDASVVSQDDIEALVPARRRTMNSLKLLLTGKLKQWNRRRKRNKLLVKLAFEKWHMREEAERDDQETAQKHAQSVLSLRKKLQKGQAEAA